MRFGRRVEDVEVVRPQIAVAPFVHAYRKRAWERFGFSADAWVGADGRCIVATGRGADQCYAGDDFTDAFERASAAFSAEEVAHAR